MMEVVAEPAWGQFKEEVEIMEEAGGGAEELLTREIKKRLLGHAHDHENGNGHINGDGGEEELKVPEEEDAAEEEEQHKNSISFDPAKVPNIITEVSARYLVTEVTRSGPEAETNETLSPKDDVIEAHENGSAQETNGSHSNGSHQVSNGTEPEIPYMLRIDKTEIFPAEVEKEDHLTESQPEENGSHSNGSHQVSSSTEPEIPYMLRIDKTEIFPAEVEKEEHVTESRPEENGSHSNGSHQVSNSTEPEIPYMLRIDKTEIFPTEVEKEEHVTEPQPEENGSHSNGSHQVHNGAKSKIAYMFRIDKTEIFPAEVAKDQHVTKSQPELEEYDLEKILDQQETHDLYCPNCKSCITRRVILKKRKRTVRPATPNDPPKRLHTEEVPSADGPEMDVPESPDVFRCLSCFSFFIPTGCNFNIFRIFRRRDQEVDVLPPPASEEMPPSENCTSWLLSCFQPGDSPHQAATDSLQTPLLHDTATSGDMTTTETATSATYAHSRDTVVKPKKSTDESSSSAHQTTTTITTTTTTLATATKSPTTTSAAAASTSSHTSSASGIFHTDVMEVITGEMPPPKPAGGSSHLLDQEDSEGAEATTFENDPLSSHTIHTSGFKIDNSNVTNILQGIIPRGDIPTSLNPQTADPPHVTVLVPEEVNPAAPTPQQRVDWDILKAIVYGGLVESITSLSVVSAAASSGAKTLDIFILGIANLIGGLPLIFHSIADLRDIQDVDGTDERVGHYWVNLGRRSKAQLHMVMPLLSYMVFGLLPPVLYGLAFRESNDRENKMMAVAGASLACIALLALGKAHVKSRSKTYFKTLMYYLTIAVSSSGLSYVAGVLIRRLLVSYGIIDEGGASGSPAPPGLSSLPYAVGAETSAWSSF